VFVSIVVVSDRFGQYGSVILVATYVVLSIWIEVAPHHFLAGMPSEENPPGTDSAHRSHRSTRQRGRRKR